MSSISISWRHMVLAAVAFFVTTSVCAQSQMQFVNASPDLRLTHVDVYVNGELLVDNLQYSKATEFLDVPLGRSVEFAVAPRSSKSVADALVTRTFSIAGTSLIYAVIHGVKDTAELPPNPDGRLTNLDISFDWASKSAPTGEFRVKNFNAVPDGPIVDFWLDDDTDWKSGDDVGYGYFGGAVGTNAYQTFHLFITPGDAAWPRLVDWKPMSYSRVAGEQILAVQIGFDSNVSWQRQRGMLWVHPDGTTEQLEIKSRAAPVQLIAASPDPRMDMVDIWVDGFRVAENVRYGRCTPFIPLTAGMPLELAITEPGDTPADAIKTMDVTLYSRMNHQLVIAGVLDPWEYPANPDGKDVSLDVFMYTGVPMSAATGNFRGRMFNGIIDMPAVDWWVGPELDLLAHDDVGFGEFSNTVHGAAIRYDAALTPTYNKVPFIEYDVDMSGFSTKSILGVFSGQMNAIQNVIFDTDGNEFLAPLVTSAESESEMPSEVRLVGNYPNPFNPSTQIMVELPMASQARVDVFDLLGRRVATLFNGMMAAGSQPLRWEPQMNVPGGLYVYSLTTPSTHTARSMLYVK